MYWPPFWQSFIYSYILFTYHFAPGKECLRHIPHDYMLNLFLEEYVILPNEAHPETTRL